MGVITIDWVAVKSQFVAFMGTSGYLTLFIAMAIEGIGLPIPMEFLFIPASLSIERGELSLPGVILASSAGSVFGNWAGYLAGRYGGDAFLRRFSRYLKMDEQAIQRVGDWFHRYGGRTVFMGRFIGFIRAAAILCAGAFGMRPWPYLVYSTLAAVVWNGAWAVLAYLVGPQLLDAVERHYIPVVLGLVPAIALGIAAWRIRTGANS